MVEHWKPVVGYEDLYQVSDRGRVRRIAAYRSTYTGRILRPCNDRRGYPCIRLSRNSRLKTWKVHTLVAGAFLGPCPDGLQVNHKNGIKEDNHVGNLEYMTPSENMKHSYRVLGRKPACRVAPHGEACSWAKLTDVVVTEIRRRYAKGGITQRELAKRYGVAQRTIWRILSRKTWAHVA